MEAVSTVNGFFDRMYDRLKALPGKTSSTVRDWRFKQAQSGLEHSLARIIDTANGHQANGQPKGSAVYFALQAKANEAITKFCTKWNVDRLVIEAEAPALWELKALTVADKQTPAGVKLIMALVGTIGCLLMIGFASGVVQAGHNWTLHLLSH